MVIVQALHTSHITGANTSRAIKSTVETAEKTPYGWVTWVKVCDVARSEKTCDDLRNITYDVSQHFLEWIFKPDSKRNVSGFLIASTSLRKDRFSEMKCHLKFFTDVLPYRKKNLWQPTVCKQPAQTLKDHYPFGQKISLFACVCFDILSLNS